MTLASEKPGSKLTSRLMAGFGRLDPTRRVLFVALLMLLVGLLTKALFGALTSLAIFAHPFQFDRVRGDDCRRDDAARPGGWHLCCAWS